MTNIENDCCTREKEAVVEAFFRANFQGCVYPRAADFPTGWNDETCRKVVAQQITKSEEETRNQFFLSEVKVAALPIREEVSYAGDEEAACLLFTGV